MGQGWGEAIEKNPQEFSQATRRGKSCFIMYGMRCRYCKTEGLTRKRTPTGARLFYAAGSMHMCLGWRRKISRGIVIRKKAA